MTQWIKRNFLSAKHIKTFPIYLRSHSSWDNFNRFPGFAAHVEALGYNNQTAHVGAARARVLLIVRSKDTGPGNVVYSGKTNFSFLPSLSGLAPPIPWENDKMGSWGGEGGWTDKTKREETAPDLAAGKFPTSIVLLFGLRVWTKQDLNYLQMKSYVHPKIQPKVVKVCLK